VSEKLRTNDVQGRLSKLALTSVLAMLEVERKSGVLWIESPETTCKISVRDGRVVNVWATDILDTSPLEYLYAALCWTDGVFVFKSQEVSDPDEIQMSTTHLLLESARRADESHS